ncbi:hypothetical protein SAMN02927924_01700 [Sphingobium faniae]|nr:hypothetical protein SAMN02927924_01700 [Sphingobium faniae]
MTETLLDLDTLIVRPAIAIDGSRYEILSPDELSVLDSHRFGVWGRRIEALSQGDNADDADELEELYEKVSRAVLVDVPEAVFARLTGSQRIAIVDVFTGLLLRSKLGVAGAMATAMGTATEGLWTGGGSFPGSNASTADRRAGGFWKRLRGWFAHI